MNHLSLAQLLAMLQARRALALTVLACAVALAVAASLLLPPTYTAEAAMVVDVKSPDPLAPAPTTTHTPPTLMATQVQVLRSERVTRRAIDTLGWRESPTWRSAWQEATGALGDFDAWLAARLQRRLDVQVPRETNVITVSYAARDRDEAAAVTNAIVQAYIDTTLELRVEPARHYSGFFDERLRQLRDELEARQQRLSAHQQRTGLTATDERVDVENVRLAELSSQVVALQAVVAESGGRRAQLGANADRMNEVLQNPILPELVAEHSRQEARLGQLRERLGERHPEVIGQSAAVAQLRSKIDAEVQRSSGNLRVAHDVNQQRLAQLRSALEQQREKVLKLRSERDRAQLLQRDVDNAQRAYDDMQVRLTQSSLESRNTQTNISVLQQATPPVAPSSPSLALNLAAALVLGGALAVGLALLRELLDRRLRTADDVHTQLRQPLLVTMPAPRRGDRRRAVARVVHGGTRPA